jgi:CheY-like chemotaxis protein
MDDSMPFTPLHLLLIDEYHADALIPVEWLAGGGFQLSACRSTDALAEALALKQAFDVVLLAADPPGGDAQESLIRLRRQVPDVPVVVLTRLDDLDVALRVARHGAYDCLVIGQITRTELRRRLRFAAATRPRPEPVPDADQPAAWAHIASEIAHDINNAMAPVAICVESVIETEPHLSGQSRESLSTVLQAADEVARTVARMRELARLDDPGLAPASDQWSVPAGGPRTSPQRILLVDDDPLLLKSLRDVLVGDGHQVTAVGGGEAALEALQYANLHGSPFGVVITDLGMADLDGRQVARAVKTDSQTPVILLTGWGQRLLGDEEIPPHVDRVLSKPPKLAELRSALHTLIGNRSFPR